MRFDTNISPAVGEFVIYFDTNANEVYPQYLDHPSLLDKALHFGATLQKEGFHPMAFQYKNDNQVYFAWIRYKDSGKCDIFHISAPILYLRTKETTWKT